MRGRCVICGRFIKRRGPKKTCSNYCHKTLGAARNSLWRHNNAEYVREKGRQRWTLIRTDPKVQERNRNKSRDYYYKNRSKCYASNRAWRKNNPEQAKKHSRAADKKRRAQKFFQGINQLRRSK